MEKEVKIENNNDIIRDNNENREIPEKGAKFLDVGKELIGVSEPEPTQEEEISKYPDTIASPEVKKALIEAVKRADKIVKPTDGGSSINERKNERKGMKKTLHRDVELKNNREISEQPVNESKDNEKIR